MFCSQEEIKKNKIRGENANGRVAVVFCKFVKAEVGGGGVYLNGMERDRGRIGP